MLGLSVALLALCASKVEVYTTPGCRYCTKAKSFLRKRLIDGFTELDVSENERLRNEMIARAGSATLPQIFIDGTHIGGCQSLLTEHECGRLQERLDAAGIAHREPEPMTASDSEAPETAFGGLGSEAWLGDSSSSVLNAPIIGAGANAEFAAGDAAEMSKSLQKRMLTMMDDHLSEDGARVDYSALRISPAFAKFCDVAGKLRDLPASTLGATAALDERKAFWVNLYNCLVMHATVVFGGPADAEQRSAFFTGKIGAAYEVCGMRFSLDDIEHGILRCNAHPVGAPAPRFAEDDPRMQFVLPELDPRIHFALNCGAKSCPPIKFYSAQGLEEALALSARAFLESDLACDVENAEITCTKLLDWYGPDFGDGSRAKLERVCALLPSEGSPLRGELSAILGQAAEPRFVYRPYDWGTNDVV